MKMKNVLFILMFMVSLSQSQVFMTEQGRLEILGLEEWDAQTLIDSMKVFAGEKPLHACAGEMVDNFGFSEVSVVSYPDDDLSQKNYYTIATIIENNDDGRLHYLRLPPDSLPRIKEYEECVKLLRNESTGYMVYRVGIFSYGLVKSGKRDKAKAKIAKYKNFSGDIEKFWNFLESKTKKSDLNFAVWVLNNDSNKIHRGIAIAILANFLQDDDIAWWEILKQQRAKDSLLRYFASIIIFDINNKGEYKKVNWEPAVNDIKYILRGTNLFLFNSVVNFLEKTEISPDLCNDVLRGSTNILQLYLSAHNKTARDVAMKFIRQISGNENLKTADDCKKWLKPFMDES